MSKEKDMLKISKKRVDIHQKYGTVCFLRKNTVRENMLFELIFGV